MEFCFSNTLHEELHHPKTSTSHFLKTTLNESYSKVSCSFFRLHHFVEDFMELWFDDYSHVGKDSFQIH